MKTQYIYKVVLLFYLVGFVSFGQNKLDGYSEKALFTLRGSIYEKETHKPYSNVSIVINGGSYTVTNFDGSFSIKARVGDELIISHNDFETIYYIIKSNEHISIEVVDDDDASGRRYKLKINTKRFNSMIDSATAYLKKDAAKSIKFIGDALDANATTKQSAEAHKLLGDIYMYWNQYDLAISAYKISLQNTETPSTKLSLAKAYFYNDNPQQSISTYNSINKRNLSNYQKTLLYEGLGNTYLKTEAFKKAITTYQEGLKIAEKHLISPKITDLTSQIGLTYNEQGQKNKAKGFFDNSLNLAEQENKKRAVEEQIKVAEFNSSNANYHDEINLRKKAINTIKDIETDSLIPNESPLTQQKQNYKIGNAYSLQNDFENAIPYLEESIKEADKKEDLEVKKDATRRLSEVYFSAGNTEKGIEKINEYKNVVDELYTKKEQEISQVARFSKNIVEKQNRITSLESDRALSQSKYELTKEQNKSQQLIIYSLVGGLILLLILGYFMFKYIRQQKLANNLLALKSLRSQMNPHFIFNALNSVNSFIATHDERMANKYLSDFSHLMRSVLENSEEDFISLKKEIELLDLYTKLEHFRFQDKFNYTIEVNETINVESFQIPPMLLQPYIENAVWHGLRYKKEKGNLRIVIAPKSKNEITIIIADNGIGRKRSKALKTAHQKRQNSKGMNNIKKRVAILNEMYKDKVDVTIEDVQAIEDVGTKVIVTLKKD